MFGVSCILNVLFYFAYGGNAMLFAKIIHLPQLVASSFQIFLKPNYIFFSIP